MKRAAQSASQEKRLIQFEDRQSQSRLEFVLNNSSTEDKPIIDSILGGVALLDVDNDGFLDIFFTNGARIEDPMAPQEQPDKSDRKFWNRLYHQNADRKSVG